MNRNKKIGLFLIFGLAAVLVYGGFKLTEPSYSLTMDVNPSIEIVSNRLDRVVEVKPLNEDAEEMLKDFELGSKELKDTIVDLADLMVLTGYISGGEDNLVMITVDDDNADKGVLDELNRAVAAYLENKQIEATIVNQSIPEQVSSGKTGKEMIIQRISELDDDLEYDDIANMTLTELISFMESKNIAPEELFTELIRTVNSNTDNNGSNKEFIGEAKAKEIVLAKVNGKIVEFKLDDTDDDGDDNPEYEIEIVTDEYKYEIEIDAYTGKILEFEKDGLDDNTKTAQKTQTKPAEKPEAEPATKPTSEPSKSTLIGNARAEEIALEKAGGGTVVEFELDWDDGRPEYKIEVKGNGYEYEIEIHGYTGKILEFEKDEDDNQKTTASKPAVKPAAESAAKSTSEPSKSTLIGNARAEEIALGKTDGGTIDDFELDWDDGRPEYEIEVRKGEYEYKIEIDGYTGKILKFEMDD